LSGWRDFLGSFNGSCNGSFASREISALETFVPGYKLSKWEDLRQGIKSYIISIIFYLGPNVLSGKKPIGTYMETSLVPL
jgi:hypothetical protein